MKPSQLVVTFRWEGEDWAFEVPDVVEVVGARTVTPVPGTEPRVLGIVTWRGRTLPVLAPQALKDPAGTPDLKRRLIVLREGPFAVPVDEPGRVIDAGTAEVVDLPKDGEGTPPDGLRLLRLEGRLVRVLDPRALVAIGSGLPSRGTSSARRKA